MKRLAAGCFLVLALGACSPGVSVTFENQSGVQLEAVELSGSGFKSSLGLVEPGQLLTTKIRPAGESGLSVSFVAGGQHYRQGPQGYFEGGGSYRVSATVDRKLAVSVRSDLRY